jgi:CubicO group peptidase (beta-lactamase class C family)
MLFVGMMRGKRRFHKRFEIFLNYFTTAKSKAYHLTNFNMRKTLFLLLFPFLISLFTTSCKKNEAVSPSSDANNSGLYFPPTNSDTWATTTPQALGWNTDNINDLYTFLEQKNTRAFLVLKDGKIIIEKYFGNDILNRPFNSKGIWYWASAGKTLTSFLVGKAQEEGLLKLSDKSSAYLGKGWTSLTPTQEDAITVRHQITMTTGLNDGVPDNDCTKPECLQYIASAGNRWAYHNAPYTILDKVISNASKKSFGEYFNSSLRDKIGMDGTWQTSGSNNVYYSTPRAMARFGLLILSKGKWGNEVIMKDQDYFSQMINTSQNINLSYGYLWWLNGKASVMVPTLQNVFARALTPNAPAEMIAAMGKNGQQLNIIPSKNLIVIRMGDSADNSQVGFTLQDEIWGKLNTIIR